MTSFIVYLLTRQELLRLPLPILLNGLIDFLAMHLDFARGVRTEANLIALHSNDSEVDVIIDDDSLSNASGQNQHFFSPLVKNSPDIGVRMPDFPALRGYLLFGCLSRYVTPCYHWEMKSIFLWEKIDARTQEEMLAEIEGIFRGDEKCLRISTVNTEYVFESKNNKIFRASIEKSDIWLCESIGVFLREKFFGKSCSRVVGVDFSWEILRLAQRYKKKVFCAVRSDGLSRWDDLKTQMQKEFPSVTFLGKDISLEESWEVSRDILESDVVMCNFGIPHQEYFLEKVQSCKKPIIMIGVGGAFDFWTGKQKRAPRWMRRSGIEWLWRFVQNPQRIKRFFKRIF